MIILAETAGI